MKWKDFFQRMFMDNGEPSLSRGATGMVVSFAMGWVTSLVRHNHSLPEFTGLCMLIGTLYTINRVTTTAETFATRKPGDPPPPPPPAATP